MSQGKGTKRSGEPLYGLNKQPRLDSWSVAMDKQIQQKFSSAQALHEQQKRQEMSTRGALPNGSLLPQPPVACSSGSYEQRPNMDTAYSMDPRQCQQQQHHPEKGAAVYTQPSTSNPVYRQPMGFEPVANTPVGGADKRVLSLLRNSLENKQQREEQLNSLVNHGQQSFQNKVMRKNYQQSLLIKLNPNPGLIKREGPKLTM